MRPDDGDFCPHYQQAIELVGRRWSGSILRALLGGPLRFSELSARIPEISDRSLSLRLKELEREGIVIRRVETSQPVKVCYGLTAKGRDLETAIGALEAWAHEWVAPHEAEPEEAPIA